MLAHHKLCYLAPAENSLNLVDKMLLFFLMHIRSSGHRMAPRPETVKRSACSLIKYIAFLFISRRIF